jgi:P4 family phage/plasmid primase-like protien
MKKKLIEKVKDAAAGRWVELLSTMGNIPAEYLDGRHHPCPKCGGRDRFRLIDEAAGAVLCNQCFSSRNGDGIAAIEWSTGRQFRNVLRDLAERLNVQHDYQEVDGFPALSALKWNSLLITMWARKKPGVTTEAVKANGGNLAHWNGRPVVTLPVLNGKGSPTGYVIWDQSGHALKHGEAHVKMKAVKGTKTGLMGKWAVEHPDAKVVWKVEGPTDMLALWAAIPPEERDEHVVVTNPFGSKENPKKQHLDFFRDKNVYVCHDNDAAGKSGGKKWAQAIANVAASCTRVVLPGAGDMREWLNQGHTYKQLMELAEHGTVIQKAEENESESVIEAEQEEDPYSIKVLAKQFAVSYRKRFLRQNEVFYEWRTGVWKEVERENMHRIVSHWLEGQYKRINQQEVEIAVDVGRPPPKVRKLGPRNVAELTKEAATLMLISPEVQWGSKIQFPEDFSRIEKGAPVNWISMENGVFDVDEYLRNKRTKRIVDPHTPEFWTNAKLPYSSYGDDWNPLQDMPKFWAFLKVNLENDQEKIMDLQQWFGYNLVQDTSLHRYMVFEGDGANGKSVACAILEALVGPANTSHIAVEDFAERFSLHHTIGKLSNISTDVGGLDKAGEGRLKNFVNGEDMVVDRKNLPAITARMTARLTFAANMRLHFKDKSDALYRRMSIISFDYKVPEDKQVPGMDRPEWWYASGELPSIFGWALQGLAHIHSQKIKRFTDSKEMRSTRLEYKVENDPARAYLEEHIMIDEQADGLSRSELYKAYCEWAEDNGFHMCNSTNFGRTVRRTFPCVGKAVENPRKMVDGKMVKVYRNTAWMPSF